MLRLRDTRPSVMGILLFAACAVVAQSMLAVAMAADQAYADNPVDKDSELVTLHKRPAFFVGSRYGRSGSNNGAPSSSKTRRLIIVPRNDRFFLGSRYGKRSGNEYLSPYEQDSLGLGKANVADTEQQRSIASGRTVTSGLLSCTYTGLSNFYRCNNADDFNLNNIVSQLVAVGGREAAQEVADDTNTK
ncbi:uncharacterized protein LOC115634132 [Scaptodrosophila lebanonensis]|uniref:Uncharacterized protein LOC115634132 n=1 Tax=Drosophila lebanonensis TaxID=7225 RepID=A0A6J2UK13_DROLE|nr:uncharacterized protein LOC115634132 [Scaptodrosophila lebanonensis]